MVQGLLFGSPILGEIKMRTTQMTAFALLSLALLAGACSKTAEAPAQSPAASPAAPASSAPAAQPAPDAGQPDGGASQPATAPRAAETGAPAGAGAATADQPAAPAPPPPPKYKEVTLAEGTMLSLHLDTAVASDTSKVEDPVRATLRKPIVSDSLTVLPEGTRITGAVTDVARS